MDKELTLTRLGPEHIEQMLSIEQLSFSHPWTRESYLYELDANPLAHYFGCFAGEELLAYAGLWLIVDEAHVANVAVRPEQRGQGLGQALMQGLIAFSLSRGSRRMVLEVRESNQAARALYAKLGFKQSGRRKNYYDDPQEDALLLDLDLDPRPA